MTKSKIRSGFCLKRRMKNRSKIDFKPRFLSDPYSYTPAFHIEIDRNRAADHSSFDRFMQLDEIDPRDYCMNIQNLLSKYAERGERYD